MHLTTQYRTEKKDETISAIAERVCDCNFVCYVFVYRNHICKKAMVNSLPRTAKKIPTTQLKMKSISLSSLFNYMFAVKTTRRNTIKNESED